MHHPPAWYPADRLARPSTQVAHVRQLVKILSYSREQIAAMPDVEREEVERLRAGAVQKMKLAHALHGGPAPHIAASPNTHFSPLGGLGISPLSRSAGAGSRSAGASAPEPSQPMAPPVGASFKEQHTFKRPPCVTHGFSAPPSQQLPMPPPPTRVDGFSNASASALMPPPPVPSSALRRNAHSYPGTHSGTMLATGTPEAGTVSEAYPVPGSAINASSQLPQWQDQHQHQHLHQNHRNHHQQHLQQQQEQEQQQQCMPPLSTISRPRSYSSGIGDLLNMGTSGLVAQHHAHSLPPTSPLATACAAGLCPHGPLTPLHQPTASQDDAMADDADAMEY